MIRPAKPSDLDAMLEVAYTAIDATNETLRVDKEKCRNGLTRLISSAQDFTWVSEDESGIKGAMVAITYDLPWAERKGCDIVMLFTSIRGDGHAMLREFKRWVSKRLVVKVVAVGMRMPDPRMNLMFTRTGFPASGVWHEWVRS